MFGIVAGLAQVGTRLITVPIAIAHLGLDGYGIWSIIMTTAAYMRFGSVGIKSAFQKYVAEATGSGDYARANRLLSTGTTVMFVISIVGLVPIAIYSPALARLTGVPDLFLDSTARAFLLLALIMVLSNVGAGYEAIVMGGHRIDLTRKFSTAFTVLEAVFIVGVLHYGYGLLAMATVMAVSEIGYVACCFVASRMVLPQVRINPALCAVGVLRELFVFAGSYQLVNVLEVLYGAILPFTVLKFFGAHATGVYAVAGRLITAALLAQDAFLIPILSGGAMIAASASPERMQLLLTKSFKATLALALLPLAFIASNGSSMILAWTGQADPSFTPTLWILCLGALFKSISMLELVLYRALGRAWMDNIRQVLRIAVLVAVSMLGRSLGFYGVLWALAVAEFVGMVFMFFALISSFHGFKARRLVPETAKLCLATACVMLAGVLAARAPVPWAVSERMLAVLRLIGVGLLTGAAIWPALILTGSLSGGESRASLGVFTRKVGASA